MKHTIGLSVHQFTELAQEVPQSKPLHIIPAPLEVARSLRTTPIYLRHISQAAFGDLLVASHPAVSRAAKALTELATLAPKGCLITAEEVAPAATDVLNGTLIPYWSWRAHPELWLGKHMRTVLILRVLVTSPVIWRGSQSPAYA